MYIRKEYFQEVLSKKVFSQNDMSMGIGVMTLFFAVGVIIGSFLNVLIARLRTEETIMGRSYCRSCRRQIAWYDNIPLLSYMILLGKCRYCGEAIAWRYMAVEVGTGVLFALIGFLFLDRVFDVSIWVEVFLLLGVASFALVISVYDGKYYEIPMSLMWILIAWIVVFLLVLDFLTFSSARSIWDMRLHSGFLAGLLAFEFFYVLSYVSKERWMGYGDAYVAFSVGLLMGPKTFTALVVAFVIGALVGTVLMALGKKTLASRVPFAPFLFIGMGVVIFLSGISEISGYGHSFFLW